MFQIQPEITSPTVRKKRFGLFGSSENNNAVNPITTDRKDSAEKINEENIDKNTITVKTENAKVVTTTKSKLNFSIS